MKTNKLKPTIEIALSIGRFLEKQYGFSGARDLPWRESITIERFQLRDGTKIRRVILWYNNTSNSTKNIIFEV